MKLKNKIHYFIVLLFYLIICIFVGYYTGFNRHWTSVYDQELTLVYNALLFNNGIEIELFQHPGYFTILLLSIFYKILFILNLLEVDKLSSLTSENFDNSLNLLTYYGRIFASFNVALFCLVTYFVFNQFSKNKIFSFSLSLVLFFFPGTIFHITQLRTELFAMFFALLSIASLKHFLSMDNFYKYFSLIFFFVFLIFSLLNKVQLFFLILLFLIPLYFTENRINDFNIEKFLFIENKAFSIILLIIIFLFIYNSNNTLHPFPILSALIVLLNFIFFNLFFYFLIKNHVKKVFIFLMVMNATFIFTFLIVKSILMIHPSTSEIIFVNLSRIMHIVQFVPDVPQINDNINLIRDLFIRLIENLFLILTSLILKPSVYSALITLNIALLLILRSQITYQQIKFNICCILVSIFIIVINYFRSTSGLMPQYEIFSDFFLILSFVSFSKIKKNKYLLLCIIFPIWLNSNAVLKTISNIRYTKDQIANICNDSFFYDWQKQINKSYFINFCDKE